MTSPVCVPCKYSFKALRATNKTEGRRQIFPPALSVSSSANVTFPQFSEAGTWTIVQLWLNDAAGNIVSLSTNDLVQRGFPTQLIVVGDNIPPTTTATASPGPNSYGWNNTNVTVNMNATDNPSGSGVKQIQFVLRGAENTSWQTVMGHTTSVTISTEGTTILSYFATDNEGNQETTKTRTVRIDRTLPIISGLPAPGCTIWAPNNKLVRVATITAADALSGLVPGSFKVTGTSSDPTNGQIVITGGPNQFNVELGADKGQIYTLTATASDLAGNTITTQATCTVPHDQGK
jgi:large repetitive protein